MCPRHRCFSISSVSHVVVSDYPYQHHLGTLLNTDIPGPHFRPTESEFLELGPGISHLLLILQVFVIHTKIWGSVLSKCTVFKGEFIKLTFSPFWTQGKTGIWIFKQRRLLVKVNLDSPTPSNEILSVVMEILNHKKGELYNCSFSAQFSQLWDLVGCWDN